MRSTLLTTTLRLVSERFVDNAPDDGLSMSAIKSTAKDSHTRKDLPRGWAFIALLSAGHFSSTRFQIRRSVLAVSVPILLHSAGVALVSFAIPEARTNAAKATPTCHSLLNKYGLRYVVVFPQKAASSQAISCVCRLEKLRHDGTSVPTPSLRRRPQYPPRSLPPGTDRVCRC